MMVFLYSTGLRVSELLSLRILDVDLSLGYCRVFGKAGKERVIPFGKTSTFFLKGIFQACVPGLRAVVPEAILCLSVKAVRECPDRLSGRR